MDKSTRLIDQSQAATGISQHFWRVDTSGDDREAKTQHLRENSFSPILETLGIGPINMKGKTDSWYLKVRKNIAVIWSIYLFKVFQESLLGLPYRILKSDSSVFLPQSPRRERRLRLLPFLSDSFRQCAAILHWPMSQFLHFPLTLWPLLLTGATFGQR